MSTPILVGLVGSGDIGRLHARALRTRSDVRLCLCRGVNPAKAEALAAEFDAKLYGSYQEMLADPAVVAVDLCVPNDLHREFVEQAAAARKAILCEKPIAMSLRDAALMADAARNAGVLLMIGHPLRFWSEYVRIRDVLRSQEMGACLAVTMRRMLSLYVSVAGEQNWRRAPGRMGGAVLDLQIHDLDFLHWTFGMPDRVYCSAAASANGEFNHVYATLTYGDGLVALVESSYLLQGDPMVFSVKAVCEGGTLDYAMDLRHFEMHSLDGPEAGATNSRTSSPATLVRYRAGQDPEPMVRQEPDLLAAVFAREVGYFVDCVLGRKENDLLPVGDSIAALRIALTCKESAETGRSIQFR